MNIAKSSKKRVVIVGGGFAGIACAKALKKSGLQVVLIDRHNYHTFQPLLYQVATGGLEPDSISFPLRKLIQDYPDFYFRIGNLEHVDQNNKTIHTNIGDLTYDYLVLAVGSKTNFFGNKQIQAESMAMKTVPQSLNLRSLILESFEAALLTMDMDKRHGLMNFVLVGGGPTGVELAGALAEMKKAILPKDYPDLDIRNMKINLIQGAPRLLDAMSDKSSKAAEAYLKKLGVDVWTSTIVTDYDGWEVKTNTGHNFHSGTVIWSAGVQAQKISGLDQIQERTNRVKTNTFCQVADQKEIFALGDYAAMESIVYPKGHPMMAQPALQQGKLTGENIIKMELGLALKPFKYKDKGSMATIGRNKAVVDLPRIHFQGILAWLVWMFIHLISLVGFRNKLVVFTNWLYNYFVFDRETRLIIRPYKNKKVNPF
ncbi:NAD(P)/FAD-dependent oxidoreductase [Flavobacteriaceae bacterium]|nr:NAD(P)/FAD-dependent oxidoreductase [Flavobacteriaceae bacterium]